MRIIPVPQGFIDSSLPTLQLQRRTTANSHVENEEIKSDATPPVENPPAENHSNLSTAAQADEAFVKATQVSQTNPPGHEPQRSTAKNGFYPLDPGYIPAERLSGLIMFGMLLLAALFGLFLKFMQGGLDHVWFILLAVAAAVLLLQLWSAIFWPPIKYRNIHWRFDRTGLEIHSGVFWKHRTSIPLARVQHADVSQGPIQRSYNLGTLTVHTAGTVGASVDLAGLSHQIALDLRNRLVRPTGGQDGQRKADEHDAA